MTLLIAVFGGAEFFPGTKSANRQFLNFLRARKAPEWKLLWEPTDRQLSCLEHPCVAIGFSFGAVRVATMQSRKIIGKVLVDGWCVWSSDRPPVFRLSHDWTTHLNALAFGGGQQLFWADPQVDHLHLWSNPQAVRGREEGARQTQISAADFLLGCIVQSTVYANRTSSGPRAKVLDGR